MKKNKAGLSRISCRTGDFDSFKKDILEGFDDSSSLKGMTYRQSDSPAIAIAESAALVGDILSLYQEFFINEHYLSTATLNDSVRGLSRLLGLRPKSGLAGQFYVALKIKEGVSQLIPRDYPFQSDLLFQSQPVDWLTTSDLVAYPDLNEDQFIWPKKWVFPQQLNVPVDLKTPKVLQAKEQSSELFCTLRDNKSLQMGIVDTQTQWKGERLTSKGVHSNALGTFFMGSHLTQKKGNPAKGKGKIKTKKQKKNKNQEWMGLTLSNSLSCPNVNKETLKSVHQSYKRLVAFDGTNTQFAPGDHVFVITGQKKIWIKKIEQIDVHLIGSDNNKKIRNYLLLDSEIDSADSKSDEEGKLLKKTKKTKKSKTPQNSYSLNNYKIQKVLSHWFPITGKDPIFEKGVTEGSVTVLKYVGNLSSTVLLGRYVGIVSSPGQIVIRQLMEFDSNKKLYSLDSALPEEYFSYKSFDPQSSSFAKVYGNVLCLEQGKIHRDIVIGSGNQRESFQTFPLPEFPLTYVSDKKEPSRRLPQLKVYVQGRLWQQVDTFLDYGPLDEVYIVREDTEGKSWIQFGEGKNGSRLPTGSDNVTVQYHTGIGATGPRKPDTQVRSIGSISRIEAVVGLGNAFAGQMPEDPQQLKVLAPLSIQSLGRMVSLADYEYQVRQISGVLQVSASWGGVFGEGQQIDFLILTLVKDEITLRNIENSINQLDLKVGMNRLKVNVHYGKFIECYLEANVRISAQLTSQNQAELDLQSQLALWTEEMPNEKNGLFSVTQRNFEIPEYSSRIEARMQNIPGVISVDIVEFGSYKRGSSLPQKYLPGMDNKKEPATKIMAQSDEWLIMRKNQVKIHWSVL